MQNAQQTTIKCINWAKISKASLKTEPSGPIKFKLSLKYTVIIIIYYIGYKAVLGIVSNYMIDSLGESLSHS